MRREKLRRWKSACIITIVIALLIAPVIGFAFGATQNVTKQEQNTTLPIPENTTIPENVTENITEPSNATAPNITENITDTDTTAPIITVLSPENATYNTTAINLNYTIDEPTDWVGYSLNGANNVTIMGNLTFNASEGLNDLVVYARDTTGNIGKAEVQFTVDLVVTAEKVTVDLNVTAENITDVPPPTAAESSTVTPKLTAKKDSFTLAEEPAFSFEYNPFIKSVDKTFKKSFIKNASQENLHSINVSESGIAALSEPKRAFKKWMTENETIETFVYDGSGKLTDIEPEIEKIGEGKFSIKLPKERAFRAGLYKLSVELVRDERVFVVERDFPWGSVSLNTRKSIYKPGETAEFIIVVLDKDGHPASGADISMMITNPYDEKTTYSTGAGTILPGEECGLYNAERRTEVEGNHTVSVATTIGGVEVVFDTYFSVLQDYAFDIIRTAQSKIDPTRQDRFDVTIDIESFTDADSVTIKEFVPAEFDVYTTDAASVLLEDDTRTITWNKDLINKRTSVSYSYSVPHIWPYLYALGPAEIDYESKTFTEARSWYVAVDPANPPSACTGVNWINCANAYSDDANTAYLTGAGLDRYDNWSGFGFSIPAGSNINSVVVKTKHHEAIKQCQLSFQVWDYTNSVWLGAHLLTSSQTSCTLEEVDVTGDKTWTVDDINNIKIRYYPSVEGGAPTGRRWDICYIEINITYTGYATTLQIRDQAASQNITSITVSGISGEIATDPYNDVNGSSSPQNTSTNTPVATIYNPAGNPASLISLKVDAGAGWTDVISDEKFKLTDDNTDPGAESTWTSLTPWSTYIDSGVTVNADDFKDLYLSFTLTGSPGTGAATIWVLVEV